MTKIKGITKKQFIKLGLASGTTLAVCLLGADIAFAASKFDLGAGATAAANPFIDFIKSHWGKGVLLSGVSSAVLGEGDPRQRATRAIMGAGAAGAAVLGLVAALS